LVVDDNDLVRELVSRLLRQEGHAVDVAASLTDALALPVGCYQAFVIDVRLGAGRGTDLIELLRAGDPSAPGRCLLLTGGLDDDLPADVAVLHKPFLADELIAAVQRLRPAPTRRTPGPAGWRAGLAATAIVSTDSAPGQP
jgi:DNA-binding response OmpR family regulator